MTNLQKNGKLNDEECMQAAIAEADKAAHMGEVPIGAVAVVDGRIVAYAHNIRETTQDPLGHAEVLLIQQLSRHLNNWSLSDVTIYVTCVPCLMCMWSMLQARIPRLVYGCKDPKAGACGYLDDVSNDARLNHIMYVSSGVCCQSL